MEPLESKMSHSASSESEPPAFHSQGPTEYEFSERDNTVIRGLARKMNFVGLFALGVGVFAIFLGALLGHAGSIISGSLYSLLGVWTQRASVSFRNVADTRGKDISHLMLAIHDLRKLYGVQFWLCAVALLASVLTTIYLISSRVY